MGMGMEMEINLPKSHSTKFGFSTCRPQWRRLAPSCASKASTTDFQVLPAAESGTSMLVSGFKDKRPISVTTGGEDIFAKVLYLGLKR